MMPSREKMSEHKKKSFHSTGKKLLRKHKINSQKRKIFSSVCEERQMFVKEIKLLKLSVISAGNELMSIGDVKHI